MKPVFEKIEFCSSHDIVPSEWVENGFWDHFDGQCPFVFGKRRNSKKGKIMKKVFEGKIYDTDDATRLCEVDNGLSFTDFDHLSAHLYVTDSGNYFLSGSGGARTVFAKLTGVHGRVGSEGLIPLEKEEALSYMERWGDPDVTAEYFGDMLVKA